MKRSNRALSVIMLGILAIVYLAVFATISRGEEYTMGLPMRYEIEMSDIDKPANSKFKDTCVPASLANAVGFSLNMNLKEIQGLYNYFSDLSGYKPTNPVVLWDLWMDSSRKPKDASRYANIDYVGYIPNFHYSETIVGMLDAGFVGILGFDQGERSPSHVITIYGYTYADDGFTYLYYVDSDDGVDKLYSGKIEKIGKETYIKFNDGKNKKIISYVAVRVLAPWGKEK